MITAEPLKLNGKNKVSSLEIELRYVLYKKRLHSNTKKENVDHRKLPLSNAAASFHKFKSGMKMTYHQWNSVGVKQKNDCSCNTLGLGCTEVFFFIDFFLLIFLLRNITF